MWFGRVFQLLMMLESVRMGRVVCEPSLNVCVDLFAGEIYL